MRIITLVMYMASLSITYGVYGATKSSTIYANITATLVTFIFMIGCTYAIGKENDALHAEEEQC